MNNKLSVVLELTSRCNQSCQYCSNYDNSIPFIPFSQMKRILNALFALPKEIVEVYLYGGEPTIYPDLEKVLDYLFNKKQAKRVVIHSNLKKEFSFFMNLNEKFPKLKIVSSFQLHQLNDPEEHIIKHKILFDKKILEKCHVSLEHNNYLQNLSHIATLQKYNIPITFVPLYYPSSSPEKEKAETILKTFYSPVLKLKTDDSSNDTFSKSEKEKTPIHCYAGFDYLFIKQNGDVFRCSHFKGMGTSESIYGNLLVNFKELSKKVSKVLACNEECSCPHERTIKQ